MAGWVYLRARQHSSKHFSTFKRFLVSPYSANAYDKIWHSSSLRTNTTFLSHVPKIVGPFDGVEKMWCAPSDHGKAQITVLLGKKIIPRVLIVEQVDTKDTTPYWQSFPDQIEFWASFDEDAREPIITHWPSWVPGEKTQGRKLANAQALPSSFKMLGRWNYDLANRRRKQAFHIDVDQFTNLVSFRVNTNHGDADQMCLHRLRLYGMAEPEMDPGRKIYDEDREYVLK